MPYKFGDDLYVIALKDVGVGNELFIDDRDAVGTNFGFYLPGETLCQDL
jgi:hypothetical protein